MMRVTFFLLLPGFAMSACGSSPDDGSAARVRSAINKALTTRDPATCRTLMTRAYVEQTQLTAGPLAVPACEKAARTRVPADEAAVSQLSIDKQQARARVAISGGDEDGARYDLLLVERGGNWRLDRIAAVELDFDRYLRAGRRQIARPPDALTAREADCFIAEIRKDGETRIEQAIVAADSSVVSAGLLPCLGARSLRRQFESGLRLGLEPGSAACIIARLRETVSTRQIRADIAADVTGRPPSKALEGAITRAALDCQGAGGGGQSQSS
jgi:hypothetical protein